MSLWWLALAIPVAIHWLHRGAGKTLPYGDIRFLPQATATRLKPSKLRRLLLLTVRLSLMIALAASLVNLQPATTDANGADDLWTSPAITGPDAPGAAMQAIAALDEPPANIVLADHSREGASVIPWNALTARWDTAPPTTLPTPIDLGIGAVPDPIRRLLRGHDWHADGRALDIRCFAEQCANVEALDLWIGTNAPSVASGLSLLISSQPSGAPSIPVGQNGRYELEAIGPGVIGWLVPASDSVELLDLIEILDIVAARIPHEASANEKPDSPPTAIWLVLLIAALFGTERFLSARSHA